MVVIPDSLHLLYETTLEKRGDQYTVSIPKEFIDESSHTTGDVYRVALLASANGAQDGQANSEIAPNDDRDRNRHVNGTPLVEEGEVRSVTIATLSDQGDGIARWNKDSSWSVPGPSPAIRPTLK